MNETLFLMMLLGYSVVIAFNLIVNAYQQREMDKVKQKINEIMNALNDMSKENKK